MKKILASILGATLLFSMSSCNDDIEIWDSAVLDYSGTYVYELQEEDGTVIDGYDAGHQIELYNTSANKENEIFIFDHNDPFDLRSKFMLNGTTENFQSVSAEFEDLTTNEFALVIPSTPPAKLDTTTTLDRNNIKAAILEAKIISNGVTTDAGNVTDSIYIKMVLYSGQVTFNSVAVPVEYRTNPDKEQFEWKFESVSHDAGEDVTRILSGHRYTGFSEDAHH